MISLLAWLILAALLTLVPILPLVEQGEIAGPLCLVCGARGTADFLLNVTFFMPLGWLLGRRWGIRSALLGAVVVTMSIEMAQFFIPGRFPTIGDLAANGLGGVLGAWLAERPGRVAPWAAVSAVTMVLAPLWLLAPDPPEGTYYGQWTAQFGNMEHYDGRVLSARVGGVETPSRRSDRTEVLRSALALDGPVEVVFEAGSATAGLAPVFSVFDDRQRRIFLLGIDGESIAVHRWTRATSVRLDSPPLRWRGAMSGLEAGDTVDLRLARAAGPPCLTLNGRRRCDTGPNVGDGWAILHSLGGRDLGVGQTTMGVVWSIVLGAAMGLPTWPIWIRATTIITAALLTLVGGSHLPYLTASPLVSMMVLAGGAAGLFLRHRASRS